MVGKGRFAMVQHNQSLCTRPGFGLRFTAEIWFLDMAKQPTFAAFKQLESSLLCPEQIFLLSDQNGRFGVRLFIKFL